MDEAKKRLEQCTSEEQTSLDLARLKLGAEGAREVARLLPSCQALTSLNLAENELKAEGAKHIMEAIKVNVSALRFDWYRFELDLTAGSTAVVYGYSYYNATKGAMVIANMMGNSIRKEQLAKLQKIMQAHPTLVSLCGIADDATEADLSGLGMDADDAIILTAELPAKGALTSLNMSNNNIGELVPPEGWKSEDGDNQAPWVHTDGRRMEDGHPGKPEGAIAIADGIKNSRALTSLDISASMLCGIGFDEYGNTYGNFDASGLMALAESISTHQAMVTVNILGNKSGKEQLSKLKEMTQAHPTLVSLCGIADDATEANLSRLGVDADDAVVLADELPTKGALASVNILSNNIGAEQANALIKIMESKSNLTTLCGFSGDETELDLSKKDLTAGCAMLVANEIKNNGAMVSANLLDNRIGDKQAHRLATILKDHATLKSLCGNKGDEKELDMSGKNMGFEGAIMFAPEIVANGALTSLDISNNQLVQGEWIPHKADFDNDVTGIIALADAIKNNGALTSLNISENPLLTKEGGMILGDMLNANSVLKELDVSGSDERLFPNQKDGPGFAVAIADGLSANGALEKLTMSNNSIKCEGTKVLTEALRALPISTSSLAHLDLSNNEIADDEDCRDSLMRLVIEKPKIVHIDLAENSIHADLITMLCNANKKQQAGQVSPCHCLCEKLAQALHHFEEHKQDLEQLINDPAFDVAEEEDEQGRTLLAIAEGVNKKSDLSAFIRQKTLFLGIYKIAPGDPAHKSATCIVSFAEDYSGEQPAPVALKFMRNAEQFAREIEVRKEQGLEPEFVVSVLKSYSVSDAEAAAAVAAAVAAASDAAAATDAGEAEAQDAAAETATLSKIRARLRQPSTAAFAHIAFDEPDNPMFAKAIKSSKNGIYEDYLHCVVLPRASKGLQEVITHDHIAGVAERLLDVKALMQQIGGALLHLHDKGVIHADLKPLNVMHAAGGWKLIDLDAAAGIGEPAGLKSSTGYVPPELLIIEGDSARVRDPANDDEKLVAHRTFDVWSFGVLLYLLVTGQKLFNNDQQDNLDAEDLLRLAKWDDKQLDKALLKVHNKRRRLHRPLERDMLQKLLAPKPNDRPKSFEEVLEHPFFAGESSEEIAKLQAQLEEARRAGGDSSAIVAELEKVRARQDEIRAKQDEHTDLLERQEKMLEVINSRQIKIQAVSDQTYLQLRKTEQVLLRGMFEATEVKIPTSFIITPLKFEPKCSKQEESAGPLLKLAEDGSGIKLGPAGEKREGWFDQVCSLGSNVCKAATGGGADGLITQVNDKVVDFVKGELKDEPMWLYLIDEYTGEPVVNSAGPYPIEITTPSTTAVKLLPIMRTGLKVMSVVNGAALVGNMLGLPIPHVPEKWQQKANEAVGSLDKESSVAEFDVLQSSVDTAKQGDGKNGDSKEKIRGAGLREYERFLLEKDPNSDFAGLHRAVTPEGQACWTLLTEEEIKEREAERNEVSSTEKEVKQATEQLQEAKQRETELETDIRQVKEQLEKVRREAGAGKQPEDEREGKKQRQQPWVKEVEVATAQLHDQMQEPVATRAQVELLSGQFYELQESLDRITRNAVPHARPANSLNRWLGHCLPQGIASAQSPNAYYTPRPLNPTLVAGGPPTPTTDHQLRTTSVVEEATSLTRWFGHCLPKSPLTTVQSPNTNAPRPTSSPALVASGAPSAQRVNRVREDVRLDEDDEWL